MQSLRQLGAGILLGILSIVVVLGGFSLAMAESGLVQEVAPLTPTASAPSGIVVTIFPTLPMPESTTSLPFRPANTATSSPTLSATASPTGAASITPLPTSITCQHPPGWLPIVIQPYDTLASLSLLYRTSTNVLKAKNCLLSDQLIVGSALYVPPLPTSTLVPCGAPPGWGLYMVMPGDTLYHISLLYRVTVTQLMQANCLYTSTINAGQVLRVPNVPTSTAPASDTPFPTQSAPTATELPSSTAQPATDTPVPATDTSVPTNTSVPTDIPVPSDTPIPPTATTPS
jgi:LysM repeat protein